MPAPTGIDKAKVLLGTADQTTTGAILVAPLGTTLPTLTNLTKASVTLDAAFVPAGFVSEDGVSLGLDISINDIREWNRGIVRSALESFDGTIEFTLIQTDEQTMNIIVGEGYVTTANATAQDGKKVMAKFGTHLPDACSWVIKLKDGDARAMIVIPNGQVTSFDTVEMTATDVIGWHVTVTAMDDGNGDSIYFMTDDGVVSA